MAIQEKTKKVPGSEDLPDRLNFQISAIRQGTHKAISSPVHLSPQLLLIASFLRKNPSSLVTGAMASRITAGT